MNFLEEKTKVEFSAVRVALRNLANVDMRPLASEIAQTLLLQVHERFESEKADYKGRKWKPWSENYRRRIGGRGSLLIQSRKLKKSYYAGISRVRSDSASMFVASNLIYAGAHETPRRVWMPKRSVLGVSKKNRDQINRIIDAYFRRLFDGA